MLSIGFEQETYTCQESQPEDCVLCVTIRNPMSVAENFAIPLSISTNSSTATGESCM